ncbi:hypothetical protein Dimus_030416 [Dionaea muscipula]
MCGNLRDSFPNASKWYAHVTSRLTARTNELEERLRTNGQSSLSGGTFYMSIDFAWLSTFDDHNMLQDSEKTASGITPCIMQHLVNTLRLRVNEHD